MNRTTNIIEQYNILTESSRQISLYLTQFLDDLRFPSEFLAMQIQQWQISQKQITEIAKLSNITKQIINGLSWNNMGVLLSVTPLVQDQLRKSFLRMSQSYKRFCKVLRIDSTIIPKFSRIMIQQPPTDFYLATHLSNTITEQQTQLTKEEKEILEREHKRTNPLLCEALSQLNPELLVAYQGAVDSLNSKNPDKQRHLAVSLRELFTHVLHTLSPNKEFNKWNTNPDNLHNDNPTREGRLRYIYRNIDFSPFNEFVERDIETAITFLKLFQKGTHETRGPFDEQQSQALLSRMESLLYFILRTSPH